MGILASPTSFWANGDKCCLDAVLVVCTEGLWRIAERVCELFYDTLQNNNSIFYDSSLRCISFDDCICTWVNSEVMWPWGHAALGYLLGRTTLDVDQIHGAPLFALLFGTQFPDLIDKPLAWTVPLLPSGRSLAHSLITLTIVVALAWLVTRRYDRQIYSMAFGIGYLSHVLADGLNSFVSLEFQNLTYLLWPLLSPPEYDTAPTFEAHFANLQLTPWLMLEFVLVGLAILVAIVTEYTRRNRSDFQ